MTGNKLRYYGNFMQGSPTSIKAATRPDFKVGDHVTFQDRNNISVTGTVRRINQTTVTVAPDNNDGHWRVSAALLNHLVDI